MATRLAIFDLATGQTETVLTDPEIVEAPNWHPSEDWLLINKEGCLFRVNLADGAMHRLDTDWAVNCNNDHGFSPDGRTIVLSDKSEEGQSCIYTLAATGGTPTRITANIPSYWHGWSPDGMTLTYTARRGDLFDIYTIPAVGGHETKLTSGFTHTDGPDYTPDGEWIWFNGERDGAMNLWRMRTDGSDLEQMTDGPSVDWFPHPDPTGQTVLYVAYEPGTKQHPRDLPVELRLLDFQSGDIKTLRAMIGGQGSINTPCWAPDGSKFAFVETIDE